MSDQEWAVLEFVERFRNGEFDGQWEEALNSLSPEQIEYLNDLLLMQGDGGKGIPAEDLKRSG
jgi:hypothetical protein